MIENSPMKRDLKVKKTTKNMKMKTKKKMKN